MTTMNTFMKLWSWFCSLLVTSLFRDP
jgi:hypothetical protein